MQGRIVTFHATFLPRTGSSGHHHGFKVPLRSPLASRVFAFIPLHLSSAPAGDPGSPLACRWQRASPTGEAAPHRGQGSLKTSDVIPVGPRGSGSESSAGAASPGWARRVEAAPSMEVP